MLFQALHVRGLCQAHAAVAMRAAVAAGGAMAATASTTGRGGGYLLVFALIAAALAMMILRAGAHLMHQAIAVMVESLRITTFGIGLLAVALIACYAASTIIGGH